MSRRAPTGGAIAVVLLLVAVAVAGCRGGAPDASPAGSDGDKRVEVVTSILDGHPSIRPPTGSSSPAPSPPPTSGPSSGGVDQTAGRQVITGAQALRDRDLEPLWGLRVGLITNRASTVGDRRVIDVLHADRRVDLVVLFAPEHGVGADGDAGIEVADGTDPATGVPIRSLYGTDRAPSPQALAQLDVLVFDLQDVGARFYTYTATMGLAMQAAARAGLPFVVLDRPNPLGPVPADGPVLDATQVSGVGLYPVPALHGLTAGELALAIVGEGWLDDLDALDLTVVEVENWDERVPWTGTGLAWEPPSPGLPTAEAALVYPATVLLEATTVSYGRGTDHPFTQIGAPGLDGPELARRLEADRLPGLRFEPATFTPVVAAGGSDGGAPVAHAGRQVDGVRIEVTDAGALRPMEAAVHIMRHLIDLAGPGIIDRPEHFDRLAGRSSLRHELVAGSHPAAIIASWAPDLAAWAETAARYRLYGTAAESST